MKPEGPASSPSRPGPIKVLAVDDDPQGLVAIRAALEGVDAELLTATSGEEALRLLLGEGEFAVILLDVRMPVIDGLETAALIRDRERFRFTPIIFLTGASLDDRHQQLGYAAGAVDYMFKPIEAWILRSKVNVFVDLARKAQLVERLAREQAELVEDLARKNTELAEAQARAERESRFKSTFLSTVSHELRTPLNAVIGFSEALLRGYLGDVPERHVEAIEAIRSSGQHLLALINDILDLSKIEAGKLRLQIERVPLAKVIGAVEEIVMGLSIDRGLKLHCCRPDPAIEVDVDPIRLKQILFNLLSNGVKFTPSGGWVRLTTRIEGRDLILMVEDSGMGIGEEELDLLFLPFQQLRATTEGTGLGLALTKRLVQLHGGSIAVRSALGIGTTFTVSMPVVALGVPTLSLASVPDTADSLKRCAHPGRIAIVDDNEANRLLIRTLLSVRGHEIFEASGVEEGIELVRTQRPDLVLMDIQMPNGGGLKVLRDLRTDPALGAMPIVALTAAAMKGDRERFLSEGFDEYISKPIDPFLLRSMVETMIERLQPAAGLPRPATRGRPHG